MKLLRLDPTSRKICFDVRLQGCDGDSVQEIDRFRVDVSDDGCGCHEPLFSYPMFDSNLDGKMCILLDGNMLTLCPGRYLFTLFIDDCEIDTTSFQWGAMPVLVGVCQEVNTDGDCFDDTGTCESKTSPLLEDLCCDPCEEEKDPCEPDCGCEPDCEKNCFELTRGCC